MYKTCIFCKKPLDSNDVVEEFPVGRRLAFDAAKGRLWVVCRKCHRWNLTPLEERWEAIETCERIFRDTRTRASTENIGIARHREGLDLVRIGKPPRREFAAWRYGDQFGTRMRWASVGAVAGLAAGGVAWALPLSWLFIGGATNVVGWPLMAWVYLRPRVKVRVGGKAFDDGAVTPENVAKFRLQDLASIRVLPDDGDLGFGVEIRRSGRKTWFAGEDARRVASAVVPHLNGWGGSRSAVQRAVAEIESSGHPSHFLADVANTAQRRRPSRAGRVRYMPKPTRLALEMSLHEEQERRALEGELRILKQAWKEAEEIAAIADRLLLPARTGEFFDRHGNRD
ncbi:MAG: hypothetical protein F4Z33_03750 [Gemmatimonadales bacterium]|nr:hypothetical protein [Gemmatimonadales bacterium]MXX78097.1 hypothetical protein [Gemmatimonadales bacterium]MYC88849.1 hypothetical protein [Candidatus Palauibacter denitrificans]